MDQHTLWNNKWEQVTSIISETNFAPFAMQSFSDKEALEILDLGSGNGRDSIFFAHAGHTVTAVDFSKEAMQQLAAHAKEQHLPISTIVADITSLPFAPDSFDVIYANCSLHYFDEHTTQQVFSTLYTLLRKDGILFARCKSTKNNLSEQTNWKSLHLFSKEYMKEVAKQFETLTITETSDRHDKTDGTTGSSHFIDLIAKK